MLSAKSRYAIISVVDIAINQEQGKCVSVSEIAKRQQISEKFLESILPSLRKNGLLTSVLGPGGGYKLAKKASSITLIQITDSVEQSLKVTRCNQENSCIKSSAKCATHNLWSLLERKMHDLLNKITVQDVILGDFNKNRNSNETDSNHDFIYMDNNATMKTKDCAKEKISECLNLPYNPSSVHHIGQAARKIVEDARYNIKHQLGAQQDYNLIFTSSGTEANNLIFNSFLDYHHIISAVEHSSVLKSAKNPIFIPVDCNGRVDIENLNFY
jgi:cysteine desulfurase